MIKHAFRQLAKNPGFTVVALATLALGIGINTTAFTVLNRLLLQALPFRVPDRLVQVWATSPQWNHFNVAPGDYCDVRDSNSVFADAAAYYNNSLSSLAEPGVPAERVTVMTTTANFFRVFGVEPVRGRSFTTEEQEKSIPIALLGDSFWRAHYGADPQVLGRSVRLNGKSYTIVGIMPPAFNDPMIFGGAPAFWVVDPIGVNRNYRQGGWYNVTARLKPGATVQQAQAELKVLGSRLAHDHPETNKDRGFNVIAYPTNAIDPTGTQLIWLIMALSGMVLLIACVNLANLQLVRTTRRSHEFGVRLALGCPASRLVGMLLAESVLLSVAGGALGLMIAKWSNAFIERSLDIPMPLDLRVLGFALGASVLTGAIFGTVPAWIASRTDVNVSLAQGSRGATSDRSRRWLRQGLVVVELSLALVLLVGAGFFVRGLYRLTHRDLGWRTDHVLVGFIALDHDHYGEQGDPRSLVFGDRLLAALRALPGVDSAGLSGNSPAWGLNAAPFRVEGEPPPPPGHETIAVSENVSPGFFRAYGIRVLQGTDFRESDRPGAAPVVLINAALAQKYWPHENPIGKRIGGVDPAHPDWAEVIGVVSDFSTANDIFSTGGRYDRYAIFHPWAQHTHRFLAFSVGTSVDPQSLKDSLRKTVARLEPDIALTNLNTADEIMASNLIAFTLTRRLLLQISVLGLLLATVGLYGVIANLVSERTREVGIRMALGAEPGAIAWLFLRNGVRLAAIGTAIGLLASFALMRILTRMLPFIPGRDPWVIAGVAVLLAGIALLACWLPARRATRVNPTVALRTE